MGESLQTFIDVYMPEVETELRRIVARSNGETYRTLHYMLAYHLGWEGEGAGASTTGKRLRPLITLLTTQASDGDWHNSLPAAACVELIHNFSLIHDDIEDNSPTRRGRQTVWSRWGVPQAVNAGDAMFSLAHLALLRLAETTSIEIAFQAAQVVHQTCLGLTKGQFLDISFESHSDVSIEDYWQMSRGKTAALFAACFELGALCAGAAAERCAAYHRLGESLGLAFQALDDLLGIWGDPKRTGKSAASDLLEGKKTLPVLFGVNKRGNFDQRWRQGKILPYEVEGLAAQLEKEGARAYTLETAARLTNEALAAMEQAAPQGEAGHALAALVNNLLERDM
jgi:geranylgeranyl diphosphate synthase type I